MKERRNKWRNTCHCVKPITWIANGLTLCRTCEGVQIDIERRKEMQNEVSFKTGERPKFTKGKFPYDRLRTSLLTLADTTKCVVFDAKEFSLNNLYTLRRFMSKEGWFVKCCKQDGKWNLWVVKAEVET